MANIPNTRRGNTVVAHITLKDGGMLIPWSDFSGIRVDAYSVEQRMLAAQCEAVVNEDDDTILDVTYSGDSMQYLGICKVIVRGIYDNRKKTYDAPLVNFVADTAQATGVIVVTDPEVNVLIDVQEVSTSVLDEAIAAAIAAAEHAEDTASKSPYIDDTTGNWMVYNPTTGEYVDSEIPATGPQGPQGVSPMEFGTGENSAYLDGSGSVASGQNSVAVGTNTRAYGKGSHSEGNATVASGDNSHAEGYHTNATGDNSHAEGRYTEAQNTGEHAEGHYNVSIPVKTRHTVGIGTANNFRKNAHTITNDGKHYIPGIGGYEGTENTAEALAARQDLASVIATFVTRSVNDLVNYYLKADTYTKTEVNNLIAAINQFHYEVYTSLSDITDPAGNVLYLIGPTGSGADKYEEYVYSNSTFVKIGDTSIDLSGYVTTTALNTALLNYTTTADLNTALAAKVNTSDIVDNLTTNDATKPLSAKQGKVLGEQVSQLGQKEILLDSWGVAPETPQVGHFYYINNEVRKITELYNSGAIKTYEVIPLTYNAIYLYSGVIYMYNGEDLIPNANLSGLTDELGTASNIAASQLLVNKVNNKSLPIKAAFGINEENLVANDYWINSAGQLKRRNPTGSGSTDIQMTDGQLFYDLFNRCLFTVETGTNGSKYRKPVGNVYELVSYKAVPSPASVATYYYAPSKKLRFITQLSGGGSIAAYSEIQVTKDMVFICNNDLYVYDGSDILPIKNDVIASLQKKTIVLTGFRGVPETPQVGDYYYSAGGQIRLITAVSGSGSISNWEVIAPSYETVYLYKGSVFLYDGNKLSLAIADTFKRSCEISTITINEELQPDASIADIKTLVLCAVKFDNSRTPANGYGKKSHPIPIGWLYYDFNNRNNIYYSFGVPDRPKLLFVWDTTISGADNVEGIMAYSVNICPNGDIVCVPRAEYFLNRTYNPIVYKHTDYEHPVEVNVNALNSAGVSVKPVGWFGNAGVCTKTSGNYMVFGEYARPQVEPANAWKVVAPYDNPANWSIVYATTGTGEGTREIEHFHSVNYDMFSDRLYIATGDEGNESYIMESTDDGENWTKVFGGTTATRDRARALNMIFTNDACYYGSDNTGALCKIGRDENGHLDFTTVEFVIDRYGNSVLPGMDGYNGGVTYYTCLIDEPFGLLLLQYREGSSTEGILFYFYDIENNVIQIVGKFGTFSTHQCGFRCDAVNYYLSRLDGRVVAGYGLISNYNDIAGNKGNDYRNLTLKVI